MNDTYSRISLFAAACSGLILGLLIFAAVYFFVLKPESIPDVIETTQATTTPSTQKVHVPFCFARFNDESGPVVLRFSDTPEACTGSELLFIEAVVQKMN